MTKKLLAKCFNNVSISEFNYLYNSFDILMDKLDWDYSNLVIENTLKIDYKNKKLFDDFFKIFCKLYENFDKLSFEVIINDLELDNESMFWKLLIEYLENNFEINTKTLFIREMNDDIFKDIITKIFNTNILYNNDYIVLESFNVEQVETITKVIKTILSCVIEDFHDLETIKNIFSFGFNFSEDQYNFIYDLIIKNKIELMLKNITEKLYENSN